MIAKTTSAFILLAALLGCSQQPPENTDQPPPTPTAPIATQPPTPTYETHGAPDPETLIRTFHDAARANNTQAARDLLISYETCNATQIVRLKEICRRNVREIHNKKLPELMAQAREELNTITTHTRKDHASGLGAALQIKTTYKTNPQETIWHVIIFNDRAFLTVKMNPPPLGDETEQLATLKIRAQKQIAKLNQFAMLFHGKEQRAPRDLQELATMLKSSIGVDMSLIDPWGQPLQMEVSSEGLTQIFSSGPDKIPHTPDDISAENEHHH